VYAKVHAILGDKKASREALTEALKIWTDADADFILGVESRSMMSGF
jgi:hypothetical protein